MRNPKLDIDEWREPVSPQQVPHAVVPESRWSRTAIGVLGTLVVHLLAIQSVMLGAHARKVRPPEAEGVGATMVKSASTPSETLILIDLPRASMSDQPLVEELASAGRALREWPVNF